MNEKILFVIPLILTLDPKPVAQKSILAQHSYTDNKLSKNFLTILYRISAYRRHLFAWLKHRWEMFDKGDLFNPSNIEHINDSADFSEISGIQAYYIRVIVSKLWIDCEIWKLYNKTFL